MPALPSLARVDIHQTHKYAPAELSILLRRIICSLIRPEKQMPALPSLAFLMGLLYHKIFFQKSKKVIDSGIILECSLCVTKTNTY